MSIRDEMRSWDGSTVAGVWLTGLAIGSLAALTLGAHLWALLAGVALSWNPWRILTDALAGRMRPAAGMWACVALVAAAAAAVPAVPALRRRRRSGRRTRADKAASLTGRASQTEALSPQAARAKARRLGVTGWAGLVIGRAVAGGRWLLSGLEDVCLVIAGPRTGKTTCWVVPRVLAARGAVVATSNKRDIVDSTRSRRSRRGEVLVFDPQGLADEPQAFWWNPLGYVTDAVSATAMVQVFVDSTRDATAQTNAYFDNAARDLVASLLLAAAHAGRPITEVHRWLNDQTDREPVRLLRDAGEHMMAETLQGQMALVPETRSGVYGSAATIMSFMLNERAMRWVTPNPLLPELRPEEFVRGGGTLYCLSQEGRGSAAPVVTALTVAVTEAAVDYARTQPGGRLSTPMLVELDEAANVCRWRELPDMYSHFGSRGILVDAVLQSWSQGVSAWGEAGMKKLWSAANVAVYGGGVKEKDFLASLSDLIGSHWKDSRQDTYSQQGTSRSVTRDSQQRSIATAAELGALPAGRAWVLASGCTPVLARLIPFWETTEDNDDGRRAPTRPAAAGRRPARPAAVRKDV